MEKLSFNATVSGIKFFTNAKGVLVPVVTLDKSYTARSGKDAEKFDGIAVTGLDELVEKKISKGAVIHIKFNEQLTPIIEEVIKTSKAPNPPTNCLHCNTRVVKTPNKEFLCINHLCPAQGRTGIFKLIIGVTVEVLKTDAIIAIHKWLNDFPVNQDFSEISYYYEFLKLFSQEVESIGSAARMATLTKRFGSKEGAYLYALEVALLKGLRTGVPAHVVWSTLNLPFSDADAEKLKDYDYASMKGKKLPKLSQHGKDVIAGNEKSIQLIFSELSKFAKK